MVKYIKKNTTINASKFGNNLVAILEFRANAHVKIAVWYHRYHSILPLPVPIPDEEKKIS